MSRRAAPRKFVVRAGDYPYGMSELSEHRIEHLPRLGRLTAGESGQLA
ncbi:hypothetical protein [Kribbella sp. VKM Ac-2569]|nr:hypothetical protein [Kribbella sp. VKM Ac-2569]